MSVYKRDSNIEAEHGLEKRLKLLPEILRNKILAKLPSAGSDLLKYPMNKRREE